MQNTNYYLARSRTGSWEVRWTERGDDGKSRTRTASARTTNRAEAEVFLDAWSKANNQLLQNQKSYTVGELCSEYEVNARSRGVDKTQYVILNHLKKHLGDLRVDGLTDAALLDYRVARGVADSTLRRELGALIAVLNLAVRKKMIQRNDVPHIDLPPASQPRELYLNDEQEKELLGLALARENRDGTLHRMAIFVALALRTGARSGVIHKLTWDRVDLDSRFVDYRVPGDRITKKRRVPVPVDDVLLPVLRRAYGEWDAKKYKPGPGISYLVIGDGKVSSAYKFWLAAHTNWTWATPHVLRHTAATRWLRHGASIWHVAGLLGDSVETTTKVYGHHASRDMRQVVNLGIEQQAVSA